MKVRAVAAASPRSNAVGTLELECTPQGLTVAYLGVGPYQEGYAPGALVSDAELMVPWEKIQSAQVQADRLWLEIAPELTPHNKLLLTNFSESSTVTKQELGQRRWYALAAAAAIIVVLSVLSASNAPGFSGSRGALSALWIGGSVAAGILLIAFGFSRSATPAVTAIAGESFLADLQHYLPTVARVAGAPAAPASKPRPLQEAIPRSTTAIVITLSACTLGGILTYAWVFREARDASRAPLPQAEATPAPHPARAPAPPRPAKSEQPAPEPAASTPTAPDTPAAPAAAGTPCQCPRADSVLWHDPIPRLTPLLIEQKTRRHKNHTHLELELAVVNNGSTDVGPLSLQVQFFEQQERGQKPRPTKERPLYFEGPLRGGHAIKWHVDARGDSFEVRGLPAASIAVDGSDAAPADEFAELLDANHRPVRLHAAMMLAFLGDGRARAGALKLRDALRESEAAYLTRVLQAASPIHACDLGVLGSGTQFQLNACLFNSGAENISGLGLKARALDRIVDLRSPVSRPPLVIADKVFEFSPTLPAKQGQRVSVSLDTTNVDGTLPKEFEIVVDRLELLH